MKPIWDYSSDAPENKKWQQDRAKLFKENGNGWWWYVPNSIHKVSNEKRKKYRVVGWG